MALLSAENKAVSSTTASSRARTPSVVSPGVLPNRAPHSHATASTTSACPTAMTAW